MISVIMANRMLRFLLTIAYIVSFTSTFADDTFQYVLGIHGYDPATVTDLTTSSKIKLPEPYCAYVNITGINNMPTTKTQNLHAWLEFYDGEGSCFKKRVTLNTQGNSSLQFIKKNISVKFYEEAWDEGETTDIAFGNWIKQDAFHLKAYYNDFFRGCGKIAYDIYDDITSDREKPLPWQRAEVATASGKAMCHPNGFPCYVYLNDKFYGLFVWSLKKSHKNMGQEKDNPLHIHIDGTISDNALFDGSIDWSKFDVRTPNGLYCTKLETKQPGDMPSYKLYDGDHPTELIDDSMPYYDPNNEGHVLTNQVKRSLVSFSNYYAELKKVDEEHQDAGKFWTEYSRRYDIQGLIDYWVHSLVTNNYDGFWKNWQWFTYDGVKWFIEPYDLDATFGLHASGNLIFPPEWHNHLGVRYNQIPANASQTLLLKYFPNEVKERYIELREKGLIDAQRYISYFRAWMERIGTLGYELEYAKWPESPCIRETIVNPQWKMEDNWENINTYPAYSPTVTYHAGSKCTIANRIWTATVTTTGVQPYQQLGQIDSLERIEEWIRKRISLLDELFGYNPEPDDIKGLVSDEQTGIRKVMQNNRLYIIRNNEVFSVDGKRTR